MKVRKSKSSLEPKYPTRRQFLSAGALAGVAAMGLGALAGGCTDCHRRVMQTTAGIPAVEPRESAPTVPQAKPSTPTPVEPVAIKGDIAVDPSVRLAGKPMPTTNTPPSGAQVTHPAVMPPTPKDAK